MFQFGRKWQPYRTASRYVPLESTQNQDSWSLVGPSFKWLSILGQRATFDASLQRGGYWWPDIPWTTDVRKTDLATNNGRRAARSSRPIARRGAGSTARTYAYFTEMCGKNHELKTGYLGWRNIQSTENIGYPNQQQYRYRSLTGDAELRRSAQLRRLLHASGLGAGLRLPEHDRVGRVVQLGLLQRQDHAVAQVHAERRRPLRPLLELPAGAGQPGHGPVRDAEHLSRTRARATTRSTRRSCRACRRSTTSPAKAASRCAPATAATSAAARARRRIPVRARPTSTRTRSSRAPTRTGTARIPYVPDRRPT